MPFKKFFRLSIHTLVAKIYCPTKLCDGAQMAIFGVIFCVLYFSELRAARFRPASYIRTKATPCVEGSMVDIQSPTTKIREERKKGKKKKGKKKKDRNHSCKI